MEIQNDLFSRFYRSASNLGWIFLIVVMCIVGICLLMRHLQRKQSKDFLFAFPFSKRFVLFSIEDVILVPVEPPPNEPQGQPYYQPPPPPMGYPPPPMGNPYATPLLQNYEGNYNPYLPQQPPQHQMSYPPQQSMPHQMPYPPQQQAFNPYPVKEGKIDNCFV